jgi:hypothetical protein
MTEHQLRKALDAANDLEPPADELFVQRALQRGRARTARRRSALVGAAAGVALVTVLGGTWLSGQQFGTGTATQGQSAGGMAQDGSEGSGGSRFGDTATGEVAPARPQVPPAKDGSVWLTGRDTPQRAALDELIPTLSLSYPDVFGGAYATDETNTRLVVTVTRRDAGLESLVTSSMPSPGDVAFAVVANTAARKQEVAARVADDASGWLAKGIPIVDVRLDARADRVLVTVREAAAVSLIEQRYGTDIVRAEVGVGPPLGGTLTDPGPPTPQR